MPGRPKPICNSAFWVLAGILLAGRMAGAEPVRRFEQLYSRAADEVAAGLPLEIEATVLYFDPGWDLLFLQDDSSGFYLDPVDWKLPVDSGNRILIKGKTKMGPSGPALVADQVTLVDGGPGMPAPVQRTMSELHSGTNASGWVETGGTVVWADATSGRLKLKLTEGDQSINVIWQNFPQRNVAEWIGCRVQVRGVSSCEYDNGRAIRSGLLAPRKEDVLLLERPEVHPFKQPVRAIGSIRKTEPPEQVNLVGVVRKQELGVSLFVRDDTGEVRVESDQPREFEIGTVVNVVGRPAWNAGLLVVRDAVVLSAAEVNRLSATGMEKLPAGSELPVITTVRAVRSMTLEEAGLQHPVNLRGVVTGYLKEWFGLFVQDETAGIYVSVDGLLLDLEAGDEVEVRGYTDPGGFAPIVQSLSVTRVGQGALPAARLFSVQELMQGGHDSQWVEVNGVIRSLDDSAEFMRAVATDQSGSFKIMIPKRGVDMTPLLDSVVRVRGVVASKFNEQRELVGVEIRVPGWEQISVEVPAPEDLFSLPVTSLLELRQFRSASGAPLVRKVTGVVTLVRADGSFNIQENRRGLLVVPRQRKKIQVGDLVEVVGYPELTGSRMVIQGGLVRLVRSNTALPPIVLNEQNLLGEELDQLWVRAQGKLVGQSQRREGLVSLIQVGGWVLEACSPNVEGVGFKPPQIGSTVAVSGVFESDLDFAGNVRTVRVNFRDARLMEVIQQPGWWTNQHTRFTMLLLTAGLILIGGWGVYVGRTNRRMKSEIAERRKAERRLAQEQNFLNALMENSPDIIYFKDVESRFIRVNRTGALKHGFKHASEMNGLTDRDLFEEEHAKKYEEDEQFVIRAGSTIVAKEEKEVTRDGKDFWVQTSTMPFYDSNGRISGIIGISRDITERKNAELESARQKHEYQIMFDAMPAMVMFKDTCNHNLRVNRYAADLMGLPVDEIEGRSVFEVDPEHADQFYRDDLEVVHSGKPKLGIEEIVGTADGRTRWIRTDKLPYRNPEGELVGLVVFAVDITEQKLAEQGLRTVHEEMDRKIKQRTASLEKEVQDRQKAEQLLFEKERFIRAIIDIDPNMIFVKDREGRFTLVNDAVCQFVGLSEKEIIGKTDAEVTKDPDVVRSFNRDDADLWLSGREKFIPEEKHVGHGGQVRWWQTVKRPLFNEKKEIIFLVGVSMDITARRRKEKELWKTQNFLNSVLQHLPFTIFIKEARELRFVMWNKAGEELTGFTNEEMMGKNDYDLFPKDEADRFVSCDRETLANGGLTEIPNEVLQTRFKGRRIMHTRKIPLLDAEGNPTHLLGIAEDVTDKNGSHQRPENGDAHAPMAETTPPKGTHVETSEPVAAPIDLSAIDRLKELDDDGSGAIARELIDLYLEDSAEMISKIRSACDARDRTALSKLAHTLKGSSRNMGADQVAAVSGTLETGAAEMPEDRMDELVAALVRTHAIADPELRRIRGT